MSGAMPLLHPSRLSIRFDPPSHGFAAVWRSGRGDFEAGP